MLCRRSTLGFLAEILRQDDELLAEVGRVELLDTRRGRSLDYMTPNAGAVRATNLAVARRADRNIIASSESLLRATPADLKVYEGDTSNSAHARSS
jgi:hypothetical protein